MNVSAILLMGSFLGSAQATEDASAQLQSTEQTLNADKLTTRSAAATQPTEHDYSELAKRVPIVHNVRFNHPAPTTDQIAAILRSAAPRCPKGQEIWFIHARANWKSKGGRRAVATVYFTPHKRTERLRAGYFTQAASFPPAWQKMLRRAARKLDEPAGKHRQSKGTCIYPYWQVSRSGQPFGEELTVPNESLLPFAVPEGFTEEEVIEIVDFVRSSPSKADEPRSFSFPRKLDGSQPIHSIEKRDGVIEVWTGVQQDTLAGYGEILRCRKREDGIFEVLELGTWVS